MNVPIVNLPADPAQQRGLNAWTARQQRLRRVRILRAHIPWRVRKYDPGLAERSVSQFDRLYRRAVSNYYRGAP